MGPLFAGKLAYRTAKPARVYCEGAYIALITIDKSPTKAGQQARIHPQVRFFPPAGTDREFRIRYWLMNGDAVLASGREMMNADEGAMNWEDGADLWYVLKGEPTAQLSLRVEVSPADEPEAATVPAGGCSTDQILKMKAAGLTDEQVKGICG